MIYNIGYDVILVINRKKQTNKGEEAEEGDKKNAIK